MDLYITKSGDLNKKDKTLVFKNKTIKKIIPVKTVDAIYAFGQITFNSNLISFLSKLQIPIYFYNYYGYYNGCFYPKEKMISGNILIKQVSNYTDNIKRIKLAKEMLKGALHNIIKTLFQYNLHKAIDKIKIYEKKINNSKTIFELLSVEGNFRQFYYSQWNNILNDKNFKYVKRVRNPPDNYINTLISFGNSLLYTTTLSEILKTQINPLISFVHEPFERRYSLNLDIADIFKPLIVDRVIFKLINRNQLTPDDFDKKLNFCYLNESGRTKFLKEYNDKLNTTIKDYGLKRNVSYKYLLRLECYKLIKQFIENKSYKSFKINW